MISIAALFFISNLGEIEVQFVNFLPLLSKANKLNVVYSPLLFSVLSNWLLDYSEETDTC